MQAKVRLVTTCIIEVSVKNEKKEPFFLRITYPKYSESVCVDIFNKRVNLMCIQKHYMNNPFSIYAIIIIIHYMKYAF